jgi:carotenoid cleavage dioxygenase
VGLLPREGAAGDLAWYDVGPCYVYHPVNAFEQDGRVVADVVRHRSTFVTDRHGPFEAMPSLERWSIDPAASSVKEERLDDRGLEFPRVDDRRATRPHRYSYSVGVDSAGVPDGSLLRHDYVGEGTMARHFGANCELGEFVFVPSSATSAEDDGVLVGFAYDRSSARSDLHILDAATLDGVGVVRLPVRVPHGFHGNWLPS